MNSRPKIKGNQLGFHKPVRIKAGYFWEGVR